MKCQSAKVPRQLNRKKKMRNFIQNLKNLKNLNNLIGILKTLLGFNAPTMVTCSQYKLTVSPRVLSSITSYLPTITLVFMLMLGGFTSEVWAWRGAKVEVEAVANGKVYAGNSNAAGTYKSSDDATQTDTWSTSDKTFTFYIFAQGNTGYKFSYWSTSKTATSGDASNPKTVSITASRWGGGSVVNVPKTEKYYAFFAPIDYSIRFNGNGSTSGSMSNLSMKYATAKNLTANAYKREYTVTYNANGGSCATTSAKATYTFANWAANANGTGATYADKASVNNLSTTDGAVVDIYAQWNSASVTLPNATKSGAVLDGWYSGDTKIGKAGDSYTPTANIALKAKWIDKYTPVMTGGDQSMMVDGQQTNAFHFEYVDGQEVHITVKSISEVNNGDGIVIEYDAVNNKIIAHNAGVAEIYFTQGETSTIKAGTSETYTYTVYKYNSTFTNVTNFNDVLVDVSTSASNYALNYVKPDNAYIGNVISSPAGTPTFGEESGNFYYTLGQNVTTDNTIGSPDGSIAITYDASSKIATAKNQGVGTVYLNQKETYKYTSASTSFTVSVIKHEPEFTWNGGNIKYYYQSEIANIFSSTNTTTDTTVISNKPYSSAVINNTLHIYNVEESSEYTLRQAENYYWKFKEEKVTVSPVEQNNHVPFTINGDNYTAYNSGSGSNASWDSNGYKLGDGGLDNTECEQIIAFTGIPEYLSFDKHMDNYFGQLPLGSQSAVYQSTDGNEWTLVWSNDERKADVRGENILLQPSSRYLKFWYNGAIYCHYNNINVTELNKFDADKDEIDFGTKGEKYGTQVNTVNFSHANAGRTTTTYIEDGPCAAFFTVTPDVIPETGRDLSGMTTCRVTFNNNDDRRNTEYQAVLVISDNLDHEERVTLRGRRWGKCAPEYTWNPNHLPYYYNATIAHVAVSTNTDYEHCPMTYSSTDDAIAYVDNSGNLHVGEKGGSVTITVRQTAENNDYTAGSATFTFTARPRPSLAVPFQVNSSIYSSSIEAGNKCYWENDETGRVRSGNKNIFVDDLIWENDEKVFTLAFSGTPEKLSFEYRNNNMGFMINSTKPADYHMWEVFESSDGVTWHSLWYEDSQHKEWTAVNDLKLAEATQYIKFVFWGNYEGYWRNINVTSFDGYRFLREEENDQYLSRGANWGTRAVVDAFGIATRVTRSTPDNVNYYAKFQFVDNEKFMFEDDNNEIYTDNWRNTTNWKVTIDHDLWKIQSANDLGTNDYYITIVDGNLALTNNSANATQWYLENYLQHRTNITKMLDEQAVAAATHSDLDFPAVTTLAGVRDELSRHGYEFTDITIPSVSVGAQDWSSRSAVVADPVYQHVVENLTPGFYHLSVKAFDRIAPANVAYNVFDRELQSVVAYVYANDVKYPITSIFDETGRQGVQFTEGTGRQYPDGYYYADDITAAGVAFNNANGYVNDVYVYVPADAGKTTGTLRYGIVNPSYVDGAWMVYGDIVLRHLDRAQYVFEGTAAGDKENWKKDENWDRGQKPTEDNAVIIRSDVTITEEVYAYSLTIENDAKVTIAPTGGLTVGKGGIKGASTTQLLLKAGTEGVVKGQTGFLRIDPKCEETMPEVTMELLRQGYTNGSVADNSFSMSGYSTWQYVGCPVEKEGKLVKRVVGGWINSWDEENGTWINSRASLIVTPFEGFANSQSDNPNGAINPFKGKLYDNTIDYNVTLTCGETELAGWNLLANSFAAPIDIQALLADKDEKDIDKTIYIFNTGNTQETKGEAGTYTPITSATIEAGQTQGVIPAMQGFFVKAYKECQFTFNYTNIVWAATYEDETENTPMRVKRRSTNSEKQVVSVLLEANGQRDKLLLIESEDYSTNFENGYDAHIMPVGACNIFAVEGNEYLAVDATNSILGTRLGVRTGEETAYTITFSRADSEVELALLDVETNTSTDIDEGTEYTFYAEPNSEILGRFQIVQRAQSPSTPTGYEGAESDIKVHKFIKDNQLYILKNGVLYNGTGALVR